MTVKLNHTIVFSRDKRASAAFLAEILGLPAAVPFGPFLGIQVANEVTLDFMDTDEKIMLQHYAFLISEAEFDTSFARIKEKKLDYWADPGRTRRGETYTHNGGRGVYFMDPSGHLLEIMTRPYVD
jgi:catechol 2,3-dioxygenase-like lactoylglutathione lyase family enzyme